MEELCRRMESSMPKMVKQKKKELYIRRSLAINYIANENYPKAYEMYQPLLQSKVDLQGHETSEVWEIKLLMANTFSVVDIEMARQFKPCIFADIEGANPLTLYDECLPQMIEAHGSDHPDVQEGRQKRKLLYCLTSIVKLEEEFLAAVANGNFEMASEFLERGVDVNAVTPEGWTALHMAVHQNRKDLYDLLILNGVDSPRVSKDGSTVLHVAAAHGKFELVNSLMDHLMGHIVFQRREATINAKNIDGNSALHVAAKTGAPALVTIFLQNAAIFNGRNAEGKTPLELATNEEVIKLLKGVEEAFSVGKNNIKDLPSTLNRLAKNFEEWQIYTFCHHYNDGKEPYDIWRLVNDSKNRAVISPKINRMQAELIADFKKRHRRS